MFKNIKAVCFDADDTLWQNEPIFRRAERRYCRLMKPYSPPEETARKLFAAEVKNLPLYGYGVKAFMLSMIETALAVSGGEVSTQILQKIIAMGRKMLAHPVVLLPGAEAVLKTLSKKYKIAVATKGDLLDQQRKLAKSGLTKYLHHIEVMSEKDKNGYAKLMADLGVKPRHFLMAGNSLKSDILPVLNAGANAVYIPCKDTWEHETADESKIKSPRYAKAQNIKELLKLL
ncbi:MAG: HAD family hydrolase [Elusimicrobiota bacterium]|jgi:putative hydrolase of the HAD superfamily|nr:HAD family hydrolase [Elusimicrobiota bacterium]